MQALEYKVILGSSFASFCSRHQYWEVVFASFCSRHQYWEVLFASFVVHSSTGKYFLQAL